MKVLPNYDDVRYLAAQKSVDDRVPNRRRPLASSPKETP